MQRKDFIGIEMLMIFSDRDNQSVRILINRGLRADTLLEMSNARQSGHQRADLNLYIKQPFLDLMSPFGCNSFTVL